MKHNTGSEPKKLSGGGGKEERERKRRRDEKNAANGSNSKFRHPKVPCRRQHGPIHAGRSTNYYRTTYKATERLLMPLRKLVPSAFGARALVGVLAGEKKKEEDAIRESEAVEKPPNAPLNMESIELNM